MGTSTMGAHQPAHAMHHLLIAVSCRYPHTLWLQVAVHLMGKGGAALVLIMLFMAVTSTGSAEQIAVSSLFSYGMFLHSQAKFPGILRPPACLGDAMVLFGMTVCRSVWHGICGPVS